MRKFIMSDIHGFGNVYYAMMGYLDKIREKEEVELYINGDLIDRGYESLEILLDIKKRIEVDKQKIIYLGGNHELMMYETYEERKKGINSYFNNWYDIGGDITDAEMEEKLNHNEIDDVVNFISNLKIYHKFKEKIEGKNILLVHAAAPLIVKDECPFKIKDKDTIFYNVWARKNDPFLPFKCVIGNKDYFTIVGHTPVNTRYGYEYNKEDNYLNIDGGCAYHVSGDFNYCRFPLVEVCDGHLKILTFTPKNEILFGTYFIRQSISYTDYSVKEENKLLNHNLKVKKLALNEDGVVVYK